MLRILAVMLVFTGAAGASAQGSFDCGTLDNAYGPYDYTNPVHRRDKLPVVESGHFDRNVENLRIHHKGGGHSVHNDLDYTLRAFPNHHRALYAMARYHLTMKEYRRVRMRYSAECYFERATHFAPQDGTVRLIHGIYLFKKGDSDAALQKFTESLQRAPESAEVHYNIGLVYVKLDKLAEAREHAERAYELGHPMPGLRRMLQRKGAW